MKIVNVIMLGASIALSVAACQGESPSEESAPAEASEAVADPVATTSAAPVATQIVCNGWRDGFTCPKGQYCADFDCDGVYHCTTGIGGPGSCCLVNAYCSSGVCVGGGGATTGHCQ